LISSPCDCAKHLERLTADLLDLEQLSTSWRIKETTFTDLIISHFRILADPSVEVDASKESVTSADFEVTFTDRKQDFTLLFQAKRSTQGKTNTTIPELFHPDSSGVQNERLIDYAAIEGSIPLYCVFLNSVFSTELGASATGIMTQSAKVIRDKGFQTFGTRNTLQAKKILKGSKSFHTFFCRGSAQLSFPHLSRQLLAVAGLSQDKADDYLRPHKPLAQRRQEDQTRPRDYRPEGSEKFTISRIMFNI